jgi:hypothetical protein
MGGNIRIVHRLGQLEGGSYGNVKQVYEINATKVLAYPQFQFK